MSYSDTLQDMLAEMRQAVKQFDAPIEERIEAIEAAINQMDGEEGSWVQPSSHLTFQGYVARSPRYLDGDSEVQFSWCDDYDEKSYQEGWSLFRHHETYLIQKIDGSDRFTDDYNAMQWVIEKASEGSIRHVLALYLHGLKR